MQYEIVIRLSLYAKLFLAGVAAVLLGGMLVTGAVVETWNLDWATGRTIAGAFVELPEAGLGAHSPTPLTDWIRDGAWVWLLVVAAPLAWYLPVWVSYGHNRRKGPVYPRYRPPNGLSPAGLRQVVGMKFDEKAMAAEMLSLAVQGHIRLSQNSAGNFVVRRTEAQADGLTAAERCLLEHLFHGIGEICLDGGHYQASRLQLAMESFRKELEDELEGAVYNANLGTVLAGIVISSAGVMAAVMYRLDALHAALEVAMASEAALLLVLINALFFKLMRTPTPLGRELLDEIAGFRLYLAAAEHERMKMADAPEMTEHLYAAYLPYAMAMDMELAWSDRFSDMLGRTIPNRMGYDWYAGEVFTPHGHGLLNMAESLGVSFKITRTSTFGLSE